MNRLAILAMVACGSAPASVGPAMPLAVPEGGAASPCVVVRDEPAGIEDAFEGTVSLEQGLFVLRLDRPRCVVGLKGSSVLLDVNLVSTGFDLRPFVGQRIRANGEASASPNALGGPGVFVLVGSVDRP